MERIIQDETLQAIADAIREASGKTEEIYVEDFAEKIAALVEKDILTLLNKYGKGDYYYHPAIQKGTDTDGRKIASWIGAKYATDRLYYFKEEGNTGSASGASGLATTLSLSQFSGFSTNEAIIKCGKAWQQCTVPSGNIITRIKDSNAGYIQSSPRNFNTTTYTMPSGTSGVKSAPIYYYDKGELWAACKPLNVKRYAYNNTTDGNTGTSVSYTVTGSTTGADGQTYNYKINTGSVLVNTVTGDMWGEFGYIIIGEPGAVVSLYDDTTLSTSITLPATGIVIGYPNIKSYTAKLKVESGTVYSLQIDHF